MATKRKMTSSEYILSERKAYSLYVLHSRAIPSITDGLKASSRRVLWMARDGKHHKSATLAGATMPIHPHASPEGPVDTLAAPFGNNIPLLTGKGAFGTLLTPKSYGASRYTSVSASEFTKDAVLVDLDLIPMIQNYDGTTVEPQHFLPLVPIALLNPTQGIAVGFATTILPRSLDDIISAQIMYLTKGTVKAALLPKFNPSQSVGRPVKSAFGKFPSFAFDGKYTVKNNTIHINSLPYGLTHADIVQRIGNLCDDGHIAKFVDNSSADINITITVSKLTPMESVISQLDLVCTHGENLNVVGFTHDTIIRLDPIELLKQFTDWRLSWYLARYQRLRANLLDEIQRYLDIRLAIRKKANSIASKAPTRADLIATLASWGVVHTDYIASLPVYRFSVEEDQKNEAKIAAAEQLLIEYDRLISSEDARKVIYTTELKNILKQYASGKYSEDCSKK